MRQSIFFPLVLIVGGIAGAIASALHGKWLVFGCACLVAVGGFNALRATRLFNEDVEKFERE